MEARLDRFLKVALPNVKKGGWGINYRLQGNYQRLTDGFGEYRSTTSRSVADLHRREVYPNKFKWYYVLYSEDSAGGLRRTPIQKILYEDIESAARAADKECH